MLCQKVNLSAFFKTVASTYGMWSWAINNLEEYSKLNMLQDHIRTAYYSRAYSKHALGAVCISNMVLEHIWLRTFFQIINGPGP